MIENGVLFEELAKATKMSASKLEAECLALGMHVGADWAGRPAVAQQDARALVTGEARQGLQQQEQQQAQKAAAATWSADRDQAVQDAAQAAYELAAARLDGVPKASGEAQAAGVVAGRAFEQRTPPPSAFAQRLFSADQPSLSRRISERLRTVTTS